MVDLENAVIRFPRGKTGVDRLCPLVPETVKALRAYLEFRGKLKRCDPAADGLFFRTRQGKPYFRHYMKADAPEDASTEYNRVSKQWTAAIGLPFTGLRSTFATYADEWPDERAIDVILGHKAGRKGRHVRVKNYAKKFSADRARRLVDYVWPRAFGVEVPTPAATGPAPAAHAAARADGSETPAND
jgi:integrase